MPPEPSTGSKKECVYFLFLKPGPAIALPAAVQTQYINITLKIHYFILVSFSQEKRKEEKQQRTTLTGSLED